MIVIALIMRLWKLDYLEFENKTIDNSAIAEYRGKQNLENVSFPFRPGLRSGWHIFTYRAFWNKRLKWPIFVDD